MSFRSKRLGRVRPGFSGLLLVSLAALGFGFCWALIDREKRSWHDMAAGTLMVRTQK